MRFGLTEPVIIKIQECFLHFPQVQTAILYGSRAKGTYKEGSDIDLTLKGEQINLKLIQQIETELDELLLPYQFDLSSYRQIDNKDLLEHIERVGQVFYERI